ncbi:DUF4166 domain-containing protein [Marinactinospora thermotolerans]|uniref:DUF4166 domain-containing protein n=1 Tax=Marinactinospora thermotolerans TaxID=531310 RepID=UPI003D92B38F
MTSIFQRALGPDFARLHPQLQRRFSVGLDSGEACVGFGTMERVWRGGAFVRPFLALGATRNILVPDTGRGVPFTIVNFPYLDSHGRETVTFAHSFFFPARRRRFDATMVFDPRRGGVVDYLDTHQHLASDLELRAGEDGSLLIRSGEHRFREGVVDVRVPSLVGGDAEVCESYDERAGCFRVRVRVVNRRFGPLFGYEGSFSVDYVPTAGRPVRSDLRPRREEVRL